MRIKCKAKDLVKKLQRVNSIIGKAKLYPVLSNVIFDVKNEGSLTLYATDFELCIIENLNVNLEREGSIGVPCAKLTEILRELKDGEVFLEADEELNLELKWERAKYKLRGIDKSDYPKIPQVTLEEYVCVNKDIMKEILRKTMFAIATNDPRKALEGAYFKLTPSKIEVVAMDGSRLAHIEREVEEANISGEKSCIIPKRTLNELLKLLREAESDVKIAIEGNEVIFKLEDTIFFSTTIEAEYPPYDISLRTDIVCELNKTEFLSALRRVSLMDKLKTVKLQFEEDQLRITSSSPDYGEAEEIIDINLSGKPIVREFNASLILDFLNSVDGEIISIGFNEALGTNIFKDLSDENYFCIIMHLLEGK